MRINEIPNSEIAVPIYPKLLVRRIELGSARAAKRMEFLVSFFSSPELTMEKKARFEMKLKSAQSEVRYIIATAE